MVSYIFIEVEDEGIGIPASEYSHIFQRFYRGASLQVRQEEGSGVGPVSYTHLDVYKRQVLNREIRSGHLPTPMRMEILNPGKRLSGK